MAAIAGQASAKPFVKWAGGKSRLISELTKSLPEGFGNGDGWTYIEPFVGGGALAFHMLENFPALERIVLNDINAKLINVWLAIRNNPSGLVRRLNEIQQKYLPLDEGGRSRCYNEARARFNDPAVCGVEQAALFMFLNRTCFNGLYRENSRGEYNVPHGRYARPLICDEATIERDSQLLQKAEIHCGDFALTAAYASDATLYYLDPPYKPLGGAKRFSGYGKEAFSDDDQRRLKGFCDCVGAQGGRFILSNSDVRGADPANAFFDELYRGYEIRRIYAARSINCSGEGRGKISEIVVTNAKSG